MSSLVVKLLTRILENAKPECAVFGWVVRKAFESDADMNIAVDQARDAGYVGGLREDVGGGAAVIWATDAGALALAEHHRAMLDRNPAMTAAIDLALTEGFEAAE